MNNYYSKMELCVGEPTFYKLYKKMFDKPHEADQCVAWCLMRLYKLEDDQNSADMMMIYSNEVGHGLGLELLNRIKNDFVVIRTQWDASTKQGREVCLKAGFVREKDLLVYRKPQRTDDGKSQG